jgi:hypothetical protein
VEIRARHKDFEGEVSGKTTIPQEPILGELSATITPSEDDEYSSNTKGNVYCPLTNEAGVANYYWLRGCVVAKYDGSSGIYYSFGGLFKYSEGQDEPLQSYGIDTNTKCIHKNYQQSNYYLSSIVNENDKCFAGPRYIIPHKSNGSELFVIDSGFYADINADESTPPTEPIILYKRNRIFVFDTVDEDLSFTNVIDSVNFDFERMSEKDYSWNGS